MENNTRQEVMSKIEKLLAKANSSNNQAESEAFFAKAAELMTKHGIEQHALRDPNEKKPEHEFLKTNMEGEWASERPSHLYIRHILRACFNVSALKSKRWGVAGKYVNFYILVGTRDDCAFAAYAFSSLEETFNKLWRARLKQFGAERLPRSQRNGYYQGLQQGFVQAFKAGQKTEMDRQGAQSYALVLVDKSKALDDHMHVDKSIRWSKTHRSADDNARNDGYRDGQKIRVNRPLGGGDNKQSLTA